MAYDLAVVARLAVVAVVERGGSWNTMFPIRIGAVRSAYA